MSVHLLLYLAAAVCWLLKALAVNVGRVDLWVLGWFLLLLTLIV